MKIKLRYISNQLKAVCFSLIVLMMLGYQAANAATVTAITGFGPWNDPGSWDSGVPQVGDIVIIPAGMAVGITNSTFAVASVSVSGQLSVSTGGTLNVTGSITLNSGGLFNVTASRTANCVGFTAGVGSIVLIAGELNIGGGNWTNSGTVSGFTGKVYNFGLLTNTSSITLTGTLNGPSQDGTTNNQIDSRIVNSAGGATITAQAGSNIHIRGTGNTSGLICGANTFNNDSGAGNIFTYGASLINFGTLLGDPGESFDNITVSQGSLTLTSTSTDFNQIVGTLTVASGASLTVSSGSHINLVNGGSFVNNGTVTNEGNISLINFTLLPASTVFTNNGTLRVFSSFNNNKGSGGFVSGASSTVNFEASGGMSLTSSNPSFVTAFRNLTLSNPLGSLSSSADFSVAGNYTNASTTATVFTNNTVTFSGTGTIGSAAAATTFNNLTISGTRRSVDASTINLTGALTLSGAGAFDADGTADNAVFTIKSSSVTQTGSIATLATPANLTGNMRLERAYTTGARRWQYIAFPFASSITVNDLENNAGGTFPVRGRFDSGVNGESMFIFKAGLGFEHWIGIGWTGLAKTAYTLPNNVGYVVLADATNSGLIRLTGTPAKGNISIPVSYDGATKVNLIPNPYPAPLNWIALQAANSTRLSTTLEVEQNTAAGAIGVATTSNTATYTTAGVCANCTSGFDGTIAPWQSFWVTTLGAGSGSLSVTESMKATGSATYLGRTQSAPNDYMRISLISGNMKDESVILFRGDAKETFNEVNDAKKRLSGDPVVEGSEVRTFVNVGTLKSDTPDPLVFNFSPLVDCQAGSKKVKLYVQVTEAGAHSLKFTDLETFTLGYDITLVDKVANKTVPVKNGTVYGFSTTDLATSVSNDRFELVFASGEVKTPLITVQGTKLTTAAASVIQWYKDGVAIQGANKAEFTVDNSGSYTVQAGNSVSCTKASAPVVMTITGTKETGVFAAYPNPSEGEFTLSVPKLVSLDQIKVADARGIEVNASIERAGNDRVIINLSNQSTGFYVVKIKEGNTNHFVKLIKK